MDGNEEVCLHYCLAVYGLLNKIQMCLMDLVKEFTSLEIKQRENPTEQRGTTEPHHVMESPEKNPNIPS